MGAEMFAARALEFVAKHWKLIVGGIAVAVLGVMLVIAKGDARHWRKVADGKQATITGIQRAVAVANGWPAGKLLREDLIATQIGFYGNMIRDTRAAAAQARAADEANARRVLAEQQSITERIEHDYQGKLAAADARYQRLLDGAAAYAAADPGGAAAADVSAAREATCRAYAGTGCDRIPALLKAAQDNTGQLLALQAWARAQAAIDIEGNGKGN